MLFLTWGLLEDGSDRFGEDSEVDLPPDFTFDDIAQAVRDVAYEQGAGGSICQVLKCNVAKDGLGTPPTEKETIPRSFT